jgi:hypothetical protein
MGAQLDIITDGQAGRQVDTKTDGCTCTGRHNYRDRHVDRKIRRQLGA